MKVKQWKKILFVIVLVGGLISGCDLIAQDPEPTTVPAPVSDPRIIVEARLVPAKELILQFPVAGKVGEILVEEGDDVADGAVLARLTNMDAIEAQVLSAEYAVLEAEQLLDDLFDNALIVSAQAQVELIHARQALLKVELTWDLVNSEGFIDQLDDTHIEMIESREELQEAEQTLTDYQDLADDNPLRQEAVNAFEEAQQAFDDARWAFEELQNQYDLVATQLEMAEQVLAEAEQWAEATIDGPDPDTLSLAESNLKRARGQMASAEQALADSILVAPFDGRVVRVDIKESAYAGPGQGAVVLVDFSYWYLETNDLTEQEVVSIGVGDLVTVSFDALPGNTFKGEVEAISDYFLERFGDITYIVRIRLQNPDDRLRWGMTAEIEFTE